MKKVRVTAKPKYTRNYIRVNSVHQPVFHLDGRTLTAIEPVTGDDSTAPVPALRPVMIPKEVDTISNGAFSGWDSLKSIFFGHTAYRLGSGVFSGCAGLEAAVLAEGTEKIPLETFADCENLRTVYLPDSVKRINMDAFKNCGKLRSIRLPSALEKIEASAFWGCRSLEEISLPDSLTELGNEAFTNCTGIKKVKLPEALQKIGACAFQNCTGLESVVIPEGVKALPMGVFAGCRNLRHILLPSTLEYIDPYAFYLCDALETVECVNEERFEPALECTPFWWKNWLYPGKPHRFPMELLNQFAGEVPGSVLTAMGYPWFDIDKKYQFFLSDYPGVIEARSRRMDAEYPRNALYDSFLINEALEPIPDLRPLIDGKDCVAVF